MRKLDNQEQLIDFKTLVCEFFVDSSVPSRLDTSLTSGGSVTVDQQQNVLRLGTTSAGNSCRIDSTCKFNPYNFDELLIRFKDVISTAQLPTEVTIRLGCRVGDDDSIYFGNYDAGILKSRPEIDGVSQDDIDLGPADLTSTHTYDLLFKDGYCQFLVDNKPLGYSVWDSGSNDGAFGILILFNNNLGGTQILKIGSIEVYAK